MRFSRHYKLIPTTGAARIATRAVATLTIVAIFSQAAAALPPWYDPATKRGFKTDLPDFYQHQYWCDVDGWEDGGGWCYPTAVVNSLYYFKQDGFDGLLDNDITQNDDWQIQSCVEIINARDDVLGGKVRDMLKARGHGEDAGVGAGKGLTYNQYFVDQTSGKVTYTSSDGAPKEFAGTAFDLYKQELLDGQDVMVRFAADTDRAVTFDKSLWWRGPNIDAGNYHFVTGAGVDCDANQIFFADPDSNKGNAKADAGWVGCNHPNYAALDGRKYDATDVAPPVPARGVNLKADPVNWEDYYGGLTIDTDGFTVKDIAANERYRNVTIRRIETICPVKAEKKTGAGGTGGGGGGAALADFVGGGSGIGSVLNDFDFATGNVNAIDSIIVYPTVSVDPSALGSSSFSDENGDTWDISYLSPADLDPWGNVRSFGGVAFDLVSGIGLSLGEIASATFGTFADFATFDIMVHAIDTNVWHAQAFGADEVAYIDQVGIPEPASWVLAVVACVCVLQSRLFRVTRRPSAGTR